MAWQVVWIRRLLPLLLVAAFGATRCVWSQSLAGITVPLLLPSGVAFDGAGNLYIAELRAHRVRRVDVAGQITVVAGDGTQGYSGDGGPATAAQLDSPTAVAVDGSGQLYICDSHNHRIRKVDASTGVITTVAGSAALGTGGDGGPATAASLQLPVGLATDPAGDLWIADAGAHRIRRVDAGTGFIRTVAGAGAEGFAGDNALATSAFIDTPAGLAVNSAGDVFLADAHNHRVRRIDGATGVLTTVAGGGGAEGTTPGLTATSVRLLLPRGVSLDAAGNLYVADAGAQRVLLLNVGPGTMQAVVGSGVEGFSGDQGASLSATVDGPRATAVSPAGLLTVADTENGRVRQVNTVPWLTTIVGSGAVSGSLNPSAVVLSGASSVVYGTGSLMGQLTTTGPTATGTMTLVEAGVALGVSTVASNAAVFSTAAIAAGTHSISVSYSGDS